MNGFFFPALHDLISYLSPFFFRFFRQQSGMDIESVRARAKSGELHFHFFLTVPLFLHSQRFHRSVELIVSFNAYNFKVDILHKRGKTTEY